jgi:hypothetical protein
MPKRTEPIPGIGKQANWIAGKKPKKKTGKKCTTVKTKTKVEHKVSIEKS